MAKKQQKSSPSKKQTTSKKQTKPVARRASTTKKTTKKTTTRRATTPTKSPKKTTARRITKATKPAKKTTRTTTPRASKKTTKTTARRASTRKTAPPRARVEVDETKFAGRNILPLEDTQPLLSTNSGADWDYQPDQEVEDVLMETEGIETAGNELAAELTEQSTSPILSGGDPDADWERGETVGEETVGGTVATPDQSRVDEIGAAVGLDYQDEEPLHTEDKLQERDHRRWELNPASTDSEDR